MNMSGQSAISVSGQPQTLGGASSITKNIVVPAVAADAVGYLDVDLSATGLAGTTVGAVMVCAPTADLVAAGAGGGYINCRVSALNTVRLAFNGALAGGAVDFLFTRVTG